MMGRKVISVSKNAKHIHQYYSIEHNDILKIEYHEPQGEGDAHYVDVYFDNGTIERIFRPDEVMFDNSRDNIATF